MTGFAATHTGSLTPSSDPWTFVGTVTWQSDIDPAILPDNEPVVLRLAFTTLSLQRRRMLDGKTIVSIAATLTTVSSSGVVTAQMARIRGGTPVDVMSTPVTVDASELTSYTAAVPSVVNGANADIAVGDMWRVDIDTAGTGAKGLQLIVEVGQ